MRLINPQFIPTPEIENQLITCFYQNDIWLLLDGVDEMGESSPVEALNKISQELTSWLGQARVVLTCRLNVWDANLNNNILPGFNTYKTLNLHHYKLMNLLINGLNLLIIYSAVKN
ncbi:hypothetical protein [Nostoc sp. MS1]|uniref:hypothetical protein n=1 Tax=Nostoc sp. MS1 TaxID=2764711 RepID=UPI001CC53064|nr:hypothetical protein [Nostoc sp. MS1]BCL40281.1 hypothetical protein NSMS1_67280 [Nostoc sp. MS1]